MRYIPRPTTMSVTAQSQQQLVGNKTRDKPVQVPDGINLDDCCINNQQKAQLRNFILRWNDSFSKDITDLGSCDLLKLEIHLTDNLPFKEPARRIPPALFQENEMMAAGAVRPSQSP